MLRLGFFFIFKPSSSASSASSSSSKFNESIITVILKFSWYLSEQQKKNRRCEISVEETYRFADHRIKRLIQNLNAQFHFTSI